MTAKSKWSCIVLALMLAVVLCGCETPEKSVDEIKEDLSADMSQLTEREGVSLQSVEITKRQTDQQAKTDTVYVDFLLSTDDGVAEGVGSCVVTYGLYNEGWMLDAMETEDVAFVPLKGVEYAEEEIKDMAWTKYGGDGTLADFKVISQDTALENFQDGYTVSMKIKYKYMTEQVEFGVGFWFDQTTGIWYEGPAAVINKEEVWDIEGRYEVEVAANKYGFILKNGLVQGEEEGCFEYLRTPDSEFGEVHRIYKLSEHSSQVFWGSTVPSTFNMGRYYLGGIVDKHFKAIFDYNRFDYCVHFYTMGDSYLHLVFIGKDSIEFCDLDWNVEQDNYKQTVTIKTTPMKQVG